MTFTVELGWRMGAPDLVDDPEAWTWPRVRERFCSMRAAVPTANVWRGEGPVSALPRALREDIDSVCFTPLGGAQAMRWDAAFAANRTDGILVLHRGCIVHERYEGPLRPELPHVCMSVTKSLVGTLAAAEVAEGRLDPAAPVSRYVPGLEGSAWATATLRQVMDMTTALHYDEDYTRPDAEVWAYLRAAGQLRPEPGQAAGDAPPHGIHAFLRTVRASGAHGQGFVYKTVNTEMLAWVLRETTGLPLEQLVAQRLWGPMRAEQDAYFGVDAQRVAGAGGALSATLRDLARFGELMRCGGVFNGRRIVPQAAVDDIARGASPADFAQAGYALLPGWSYRAMWWVTHNAHGAYCARGIHGQGIYIDPAAEMVVARFASHPGAGNANLDPTTLPAYHALAQHLMANP